MKTAEQQKLLQFLHLKAHVSKDLAQVRETLLVLVLAAPQCLLLQKGCICTYFSSLKPKELDLHT